MEILTKIPKVLNKTQVLSGLNLLPAAGLEPARGCPQQILSLPRLPFRHAGFSRLIKPRIIISQQLFVCKELFPDFF